MKQILLCALLCGVFAWPLSGQARIAKPKKNEYVVLASRDVIADPACKRVAYALRAKHHAPLLHY
jgi:hypothetical protein